MRPVYVFWSSDVSEEESRIFIQALTEIGRFLPSEEELHIQTFGNWFQGKEPYQSLRWYEERSWIPERRQLDGDNILINFSFEPWQESQPHIDLAVFGRDLTARNHEGDLLNFIFGLSGDRGAVISTSRFNWELRDKTLRHLCLRRAVLHEFCHILGLIPKWRTSNLDTRLGPHCTNLCVMRQGISVPEWVEYTVEERERGIILCSQCQENLLTLLRVQVAP